jgi:hypothetical protein
LITAPNAERKKKTKRSHNSVAIEELGLIRAMKQGKTGKLVSEARVMAILGGRKSDVRSNGATRASAFRDGVAERALGGNPKS